MDTLDGIAAWWIERQRIRAGVVAVAAALDRLVGAGVVEKVGTGRAALYRRGATRLAVATGQGDTGDPGIGRGPRIRRDV